MDIIFTSLGIAGAFLCILMFFLLERGWLDQADIRYYMGNGIGAFGILTATFYNFDDGDSGAILQEFCWIGISLLGIISSFNKGRKKI